MYHFTLRKLCKIMDMKRNYRGKHAVFKHTLHKEMWRWLTDNFYKEKAEWPGWKHNGGNVKIVMYGCFACEYARVYSIRCTKIKSFSICDYCPFKINHNKTMLEWSL